jgi:hypothetical protein
MEKLLQLVKQRRRQQADSLLGTVFGGMNKRGMTTSWRSSVMYRTMKSRVN